MGLISINGRIGAGKDEVGKIINYLTAKQDTPTITYLDYCEALDLSNKYIGGFEIKKFADSTTKAFEIITGINYHRLNREEKEKIRPLYVKFAEGCKVIFSEDVWVNSLMNEYKEQFSIGNNELCNKKEFTWYLRSLGKTRREIIQDLKTYDKSSNWIITDLRYPNELKAVKDRGGISIRVKRAKEPLYDYLGDKVPLKELFYLIHKDTGEYPLKAYADKHWLIKESEHESETALDNAIFDYEINNDGTIEELIEKVRVILIKEKII